MSTEHDYTIGSEQYLWLEADLASVDRTVTPWIIFGGHRAMYLNSNYVDGVTSDGVVMDNLIANVEPLLWKYRVNLAFWGHNHVVQRQSAVLNKTVIQRSQQIYESGYTTPTAYHDDPQATVHMVIGTAGAKFTVNYVEPYPDWCEMVFYRYGYARVVTVNASRLEWEWVSSLDGEIYDRMVIEQGDPSQPWVIDSNTDDDTKKNNNDNNSEGLTSLEKGFALTGIILAVAAVAIALFVLVTKYVVKSDEHPPLTKDMGGHSTSTSF